MPFIKLSIIFIIIIHGFLLNVCDNTTFEVSTETTHTGHKFVHLQSDAYYTDA